MHDAQNPQADQMGHISMVRTLAAQAEAIWPQESQLFDRYHLQGALRILDLGCGTGEATARLAARYPESHLLGLDLLTHHLETARQRSADFGERVTFREGNALAIDEADNTFDLAVCRHMLQVVPDAEKVLDEMLRVTRPGGWIHLLVEDYAMVHHYPGRDDSDHFWLDGPIAFGASVGTDMRVGRKVVPWLLARKVQDLAIHYVVVDTVRVPRATIIVMMDAWKEGFADVIAEQSSLPLEAVLAHFDDILACLRNPEGYFAWQVPVVSGRVPG
ncbi:MAG TPA: methyltransferase domain-containing protein [Rhodothermales bacterium]|nr:methyltransferase domain-containing protein [Rhodothermales bacterium]